jgi:2-haloacid dehalogenase
MATPSPFQPCAIIFDLLTALLDSWSLWNTAAGSGSLGLTWRKAYLELTYGCGTYVPYEDLVQQSAAQAGLGPEAPAKLLQDWKDLQPWPETLLILSKLQSKGLKLGVVTNCSTHLGQQASSFFPFDAVVTAEQSGFYKPCAKPYLDVLAALDIEAKDALFVAGSSADVPGASSAGMKVVWHNRVGLEAKGDVKPMSEGRTLNEVLAPWL